MARHAIPVALNRGIRGFQRPGFEIERSIAAIADAQLGLITTAQLLAVGLSQDAIDRRVASGRLTRIYQGVFAVGRLRLDDRARWKAATLAVGRGDTLLGHLCAGGLWEIWPEPQGQPHVVLPGNGRHRRIQQHGDGIVVHRMRRMEASDRSEVGGIPVTSLELTCLHLASLLSRRSFERAVLRAARRPEFRIEEAVALAARSRGRPGVREFRAVVERDLTAELHSLSELETRFVQVLRHHGLPMPEINRDVEALMVDAVWHEAKAIVELDGFAFHRLPRDLRNDNARTRRLVLAGYRVIRFVWDDVVGNPAGVAEAVRRLIHPGRS
jgi:very-short-patch-repair endonuclease